MRLKLTALVYALMVIAKVVCYYLTGYLVILAEALHNIVDVSVFATLLYSERISRKPPDHVHPLGHELARNLGCVTVAVVFITLIAFELIREGFERILNPAEGRYPEVALAVLLASVLVLILITAVYRGKRTSTEESAFFELINDVASSSGAVFGVFMTSHGYPIVDGTVSVLIALLIAFNGYRLFKKNASYLLGRSPSDDFYDRVRRIVESFPEVIDVHDMIAVYIGENKVHLDMHVTVREDMTVKEADELTTKIARRITDEIPDVAYVLIHVCAEKGKFVRSTYDKAMEKVKGM